MLDEIPMIRWVKLGFSPPVSMTTLPSPDEKNVCEESSSSSSASSGRVLSLRPSPKADNEAASSVRRERISPTGSADHRRTSSWLPVVGITPASIGTFNVGRGRTSFLPALHTRTCSWRLVEKTHVLSYLTSHGHPGNKYLCCSGP